MPSDEDLMLKYQAGDAAAFDILYEKYRGDVYRYLLRQYEPGTAEELYHDIWLKLIQARDRYVASASFRTWLYTIVHNRLHDYRRKLKHAGLQAAGADYTLPEIADSNLNNPEHINNDRQAVAKLLEGIDLLPTEQKQAFLLKVESGLPLEDIARVMHASTESTKSRLRYATRKLREHLKGIWP